MSDDTTAAAAATAVPTMVSPLPFATGAGQNMPTPGQLEDRDLLEERSIKSNTANRIDNLQQPPNAVNEAEATEAEDDDFPGNLICPVNQEPPAHACSFDLTFPYGSKVQFMVFEYSTLIRHISYKGPYKTKRKVCHPVFEVLVPRAQALSHVHLVSPEIQARITQEQRRCNLPEQDPEPLTEEDWDRFEATINDAFNP
jgi:hypothetical protein